MKSLNLAVIVTSVLLAASSMAQAENTNATNGNFISKRPYHAPVENNKATKADEQFEGATLIPEDAVDENSAASKNERNLKQLRLHSLGRRPYME